MGMGTLHRRCHWLWRSGVLAAPLSRWSSHCHPVLSHVFRKVFSSRFVPSRVISCLEEGILGILGDLSVPALPAGLGSLLK